MFIEPRLASVRYKHLSLCRIFLHTEQIPSAWLLFLTLLYPSFLIVFLLWSFFDRWSVFFIFPQNPVKISLLFLLFIRLHLLFLSKPTFYAPRNFQFLIWNSSIYSTTIQAQYSIWRHRTIPQHTGHVLSAQRHYYAHWNHLDRAFLRFYRWHASMEP